MPYNRRDFIQTIAMAGAALPFSSFKLRKDWEIHAFSKPFQWMDYQLLCETFAAAGLDGVDYTVRPEGHVLPERVTTDLPKAAKAARDAGLKTTLMTTAILEAEGADTLLKTAADQGVKYYRMGWYDYIKGKSIQESIRVRSQQLKELAKLNSQLNIQAAYQNHAGLKVGASVWDLYAMIKDVDPKYAGVQYDIRHATVEGANSWPLGLELIREHINTLVIKDCKWVNNTLQNVPLGEGMVNFKAFFQKVKEYNIHVPITLHLEYELLSKAQEALPVKEKQQIVLGKLKKDVQVLKGMLAGI
ncbi:sugar phosphate isomerase/epimerase family protein [Chitinophaga niabensis]|uniref:Tat (Twin-arginine translocation) pathway signal sequence n=1 Tax=Chitinophaga niabensis TaxID=536979 RepID=A0A1N6JAV2_9BACT|nr:TIM barrel protein [Chitinophaga niabensis]SIO41460.1 Tat (twin-arginine translocation) pathway signal sequence [Chitinophaga niabensis]